MAGPILYSLSYSYTGFQQSQGDNSFPGMQLDADLAGLEQAIENVSDFAKNVVRADGALNNGVVTFDSLSPSLQTAGLSPAANWLTATLYAAGKNVVTDGKLYRALIEHTSGVFATDLAAGKWLFVADLPVSDLAIAGPASAVVGHLPVFSHVDGKHLSDSGVALASLAPLSSPVFTGTPTAPTAALGTDSTVIATTEFVAATTAPLVEAITDLAPLASPAFTGAPTAPTANPGTNSDVIASTAYVDSAVGTDRSVHVVLATGQSNIYLHPAYSWSPQPNLFLWNGEGVVAGTHFAAMDATTMGMSYSYANEYAKEHPSQDVYLINIGVGGIPISKWMAGSPSPDMYAACKAAIESALLIIGVDMIDEMIWWQGDTDAIAASTTYPANFETVIARFQAETWFAKATPITVMGITRFNSSADVNVFNYVLRNVVSAKPDVRTFVNTAEFLPIAY